MADLSKYKQGGVSDEDLARHQSSEGGKGTWACKPDGLYEVTLTEVKTRDTKNGGVQVVFTTTHLGKGYKGKQEIENVNLICPGSPQAETIARARLKAYAVAVGHPKPGKVKDTDTLLNIPFEIRLGRKKASGEYSDVNGYEQVIYSVLALGTAKKKSKKSEKKRKKLSKKIQKGLDAEEDEVRTGPDGIPF